MYQCSACGGLMGTTVGLARCDVCRAPAPPDHPLWGWPGSPREGGAPMTRAEMLKTLADAGLDAAALGAHYDDGQLSRMCGLIPKREGVTDGAAEHAGQAEGTAGPGAPEDGPAFAPDAAGEAAGAPEGAVTPPPPT